MNNEKIPRITLNNKRIILYLTEKTFNILVEEHFKTQKTLTEIIDARKETTTTLSTSELQRLAVEGKAVRDTDVTYTDPYCY